MPELQKNMTQIFSKLNDLKNIFKFGEKIVPIIQSLIEFMKEVVPLLENINSSIADSTSQMPKAASQISNVTSATELATTEILDLVDENSNFLSGIDTTINGIIKNQDEQRARLKKMFAMLQGNPEAEAIISEVLAADNQSEQLKTIQEEIAKINNDNYKITLSLQVQDITSQQLAAVNHLISSVHLRLSSLVDDINQNDIEGDMKTLSVDLPTDGSFDPNASYETSGVKQKKADKVIEKEQQKQQQMTSQEEIDKLFS